MMLRRLGDERYQVEAPDLPRQTMPRWLLNLLIGAVIGVIVLGLVILGGPMDEVVACLLYTSDAADDM
jgi:hypothetical protein